MILFEKMASDLAAALKGEPFDKKALAIEGALRAAYEMGQVSVLREVKARMEQNENMVTPV